MEKIIRIIVLILIPFLFLNGCYNKNDRDRKNDKIKVGFLFVGPIGDGGWNYAHNQGKLEIEELPFISEIIYRENATDKESSLVAIDEIVKEGAELIFATSFNHKEAVLEKAKEYPNVIFESCSTFIESANIASYFGKIHQGWYLAGIAAGMKSESGKIGMIVAHANPECKRITNSFALGIKSINPEAKVYIEWLHSWYNPHRENFVANKMIDMGCDIIAHNSDSSESQKVADSRDVYSIGYNTDMRNFAPKKNLVSVVWNWGPFYKETLEQVYNKTWEPSIIWGDISTGMFGLTDLSPHFKEADISEIEKIKAKLVSKELEVFSGEIRDNEGQIRIKSAHSLSDSELLSIDWLVDNIIVLNPIAK